MRAPLLEPDGSQNERPAVNSPSRFAQYHASVLRCFKLKARKPVWCAAEILLPIAFVGLLAWLSTLVTAKDHDGGTSTQSSFAHQSRGLIATCLDPTPLLANVASLPTVLRIPYAMSGTDLGYAATRLLAAHAKETLFSAAMSRYAVSSAICLGPLYAMPGTDTAYAATGSRSTASIDPPLPPPPPTGNARCGGQFTTEWLSPRLCIVPAGRILLRLCWAISGTDEQYRATRALGDPTLAPGPVTCLRARYAMPGTDLAYGATLLGSAPDLRQYGHSARRIPRSSCAFATRCLVLTLAMLLLGRRSRLLRSY
eukprot:69807-Rhodomonas_salina.3